MSCLSNMKQSMTYLFMYAHAYDSIRATNESDETWGKRLIRSGIVKEGERYYKVLRCPLITNKTPVSYIFGMRRLSKNTTDETIHKLSARNPARYVVLVDSIDATEGRLYQCAFVKGRIVNDDGSLSDQYGLNAQRIDFRHSLRANVGFIDGHVAPHKWRDELKIWEQCPKPYPDFLMNQ